MKNIILILLLFVSCKNHSADKIISEDELNEKLTKMNILMVGNESKRIDEFINRHSFNTIRTGSGLRYQIYTHGEGEKAKNNEQVLFNCNVFLLDGKKCYSTDTSGPLNIKLGFGEQVSGLEEALLLMVPGDKAHIILPAHLAYGMTGDQANIPPASALYYDVELLKLIK